MRRGIIEIGFDICEGFDDGIQTVTTRLLSMSNATIEKDIVKQKFTVRAESPLFDESEIYIPYYIAYIDEKLVVGRVVRDDFVLSRTKLFKMQELFNGINDFEIIINDVETDDLFYCSSASFVKMSKESREAIRKILLDDYTKQLSELKKLLSIEA